MGHGDDAGLKLLSIYLGIASCRGFYAKGVLIHLVALTCEKLSYTEEGITIILQILL